jgi:hypothetical protein
MELSPEVVKNLTKEQLELLIELGELARKEAELTEIVENNRRRAEMAGLGREREVAKSLMDDQEFDNLLSVQVIYQREQVRDKIKSVLQSLIQANMASLGIIQRHAASYGVDLTAAK